MTLFDIVYTKVSFLLRRVTRICLNGNFTWRYIMDGFKIFKDGKAIKEDENKAGRFKLMIQDEDFEIFESHIHAGRSVICQPYECRDSLNVVFVLSGRLYHTNSKSYILAGEHYTFKNLKETHHLSVEEETKLLMIRKKSYYIEQVSRTNEVTKIIDMIQEKDDYTEGHCNRTGNIAAKMATYLKLSDKIVHNVLYIGKIHDVGKIDIPVEILNKPGKLTAEEFELIKKHSQRGHDIIMETMGHSEIAKVILQHHEKLDGSGYPFGLKGDEISMEAKIISVADSFDAMTSNRPYRNAMNANDAIKELRAYSGKWYEEEIVEALAATVEDLVPGT